MANDQSFLDIDRIIFMAVVFFSEDDIGITDYDYHRSVMTKLNLKNHPVLKWITDKLCKFEGIEEMVEETLIKNSPPRNQEECSKRLRALFEAIEKRHGYTADDAMRDIKRYLN